MVIPSLSRHAIGNELSWLWAIVNEADLRRLVAWERKWYSYRVVTPVSAALTLGAILSLYVLAFHGSGVPVPAGTLYIVVFLVFLGISGYWCEFMMAPEAHNMTTCKFELYRLSPADSVAVRQSLRGYNQIAAIFVMMSTLLTLFLVILLPGGSAVVALVVLALLLVSYVGAAVAVLSPRLLMGRIIQRKKEEEMNLLQVQLDDLLPRIRELTEEEYGEMTRLQKAHDAIRNSPENLLPLGPILRTVGALLLSTVTVLATAFAQEWIAGLVKRFAP